MCSVRRLRGYIWHIDIYKSYWECGRNAFLQKRTLFTCNRYTEIILPKLVLIQYFMTPAAPFSNMAKF